MTDLALENTLLDLFRSKNHDLTIFMEGVLSYISRHPKLNNSTRPIIHSSKSRVKNSDHLREKIKRKIANGSELNEDNFFQIVTDLAGVRLLHLYQQDFSQIDAVIREKVVDGDWVLGEQPKAYTWDPENYDYFSAFDLELIKKPTSYTSVHYLIRPRADSPICCEIQVRTLFEEIWGEVDHQINYPTPTNNVACKEQIKVLSKIVGAGSRLLDSLQRVQDQNPN